jgi:hypothetical protein
MPPAKYSRYCKVGGSSGLNVPCSVVKKIEITLFGEGAGFTFTPVDANFDGLTVPWGNRCFVAPPHNAAMDWLMKARQEVQNNRIEAAFLLPFRPCTRYLSEVLTVWPEVARILIFRNGITFTGFSRVAPFLPCVILLRSADLNPPPVTTPRFGIFDTIQSVIAQDVADQLRSTGHKFDHVGLIDDEIDLAAVSTTASVLVTRSTKIGDVAKSARARKGNTSALVAMRPSSRDYVREYIDADYHPARSRTLAFIVPHLRVAEETKTRLSYGSMLVTWPALSDGVCDLLHIVGFSRDPEFI